MTTREEMLNCDLGVYRVYWKGEEEGEISGHSVACIGNDYNGNRWFAAANWTCPVGGNPTTLLRKYVDQIAKMEKLA